MCDPVSDVYFLKGVLLYQHCLTVIKCNDYYQNKTPRI
jgi:hypothetical protein